MTASGKNQMISGPYLDTAGASEQTSFGVLARQVLSLDAAIEWLALEQAGCKPRFAWREPGGEKLWAGATANHAQVVDPLVLMFAEGSYDRLYERTPTDPHRLLFMVLARANIVHVVARLGPDAHVTVGIPPGIDPYLLGKKLAGLLEHCTQLPAMD